jgi:hypothetical protein
MWIMCLSSERRINEQNHCGINVALKQSLEHTSLILATGNFGSCHQNTLYTIYTTGCKKKKKIITILAAWIVSYMYTVESSLTVPQFKVLPYLTSNLKDRRLIISLWNDLHLRFSSVDRMFSYDMKGLIFSVSCCSNCRD